MTKKQATDFAVAIAQYQQIKDYYKIYGELNPKIESALNKIYKDIAITTNIDVDTVTQKLRQDIEE